MKKINGSVVSAKLEMILYIASELALVIVIVENAIPISLLYIMLNRLLGPEQVRIPIDLLNFRSR